MSEKQMNETKKPLQEQTSVEPASAVTETSLPENNVDKASGKSVGKKWGIIGAIVVVLIAVIVGIAIYNTPANRISRLLDLGNRYLDEQDYEQAAIAFNKAIAIDPKNVDAYLGLADAYLGMDDLQAALDTLQKGYELTNDERLKVRLDEVEKLMQQGQTAEEVQQAAEDADEPEETDTLEQLDSEGEESGSEGERSDENIATDEVQDEAGGDITLSINMADVKIMGYDLMGPHFHDLIDAFGVTLEAHDAVAGDFVYGAGVDSFIGNTQYGYMRAYDHRGDWDDIAGVTNYEIAIYNDNNTTNVYPWFLYVSKPYEAVILRDKNKRAVIEEICDLPLVPGDTYETWCETLGIEEIKSAVNGETDANGATIWDNIMDSQRIAFTDGWYVEKYEEGESIDYNTNHTLFSCSLHLRNDAGTLVFIMSDFEGDEMVSVTYMRY